MGNTCACIRHSEVVPPTMVESGHNDSMESGHNDSMESGHNETAAAAPGGHDEPAAFAFSGHDEPAALAFGGHDETAVVAFGGERVSGSGGGPVRCDDSESLKRVRRSGNVGSDVDKRIESSKAHWSELTKRESDVDDEQVAQENRQVFEELQFHSTWGEFFWTFGYDTKVRLSRGELVVEEKFAEGGQAELFHAKVIWRDRMLSELTLEEGREYVLKVFKKGTRLRDLQSQWPVGYLQWRVELRERNEHNLPPPLHYRCYVWCGTMLEDGRFAFLMGREDEDLQSQIDCAMLDIEDDQGPFPNDKVERIMFQIALGMNWLHSHNIVHRDLKASNVLVWKPVGYLPAYYVADFECSVGVVGTGFFRAPEILQAIKDKAVGNNPKVFSKEADVYSYGMTFYEVLTGKLPFQDHPLNEYDLVLNGQRPRIPGYVDSWMRELLNRCWDVDCSKRPSFGEILEIFSSNSATARDVQLNNEETINRSIRKHKERLLRLGLVVEPN